MIIIVGYLGLVGGDKLSHFALLRISSLSEAKVLDLRRVISIQLATLQHPVAYYFVTINDNN